jgi:hypothetical protein
MFLAMIILGAGIALIYFYPNGDGGFDFILGAIICVVGLGYAFQANGYSWICPKCKTRIGNIS